MGMAASQARFLGLTARKSNVEYQGQQVNQQRTALANESSNLYSQMMNLDVPVPPSQSDYYKTVYTLDGSNESYLEDDYTISNLSKTHNGVENQYMVTLTNNIETIRPDVDEFILGAVKYENVSHVTTTTTDETTTPTDDDTSTPPADEETTTPSADDDTTPSSSTHKVYTIPISQNETSYTNLTYDEYNNSPYNKDGKFSIGENQIYELPEKTILDTIPGYYNALAELQKEEGENASFSHFYQDVKGDYHFITQKTFDALLAGPQEDKENNIYTYGVDTYYKEQSVNVLATMEQSDNGRFSSITIAENEEYPSELSGETFTITMTQVQDKEAYEDAFNDYEYQKALYDQTISEINAQTEIVQRQDQKLELRLEQLDTEQSAIKTEMDAVTKVIDDNIEKTFKTFA